MEGVQRHSSPVDPPKLSLDALPHGLDPAVAEPATGSRAPAREKDRTRSAPFHFRAHVAPNPTHGVGVKQHVGGVVCLSLCFRESNPPRQTIAIVNVGEVESGNLGEPEPGSERQGEDRVIARCGARVREQTSTLGKAKRAAFHLLWIADGGC